MPRKHTARVTQPTVTGSARRRPDMRLYLDDYRLAPEGWIPVRTPDDFKYLVSCFDWDVISFDYDLSAQRTSTTGKDLLEWMLDEGYLPLEKPRVHSQDPDGAPAMRSVIEARWPKGRESRVTRPGENVEFISLGGEPDMKGDELVEVVLAGFGDDDGDE